MAEEKDTHQTEYSESLDDLIKQLKGKLRPFVIAYLGEANFNATTAARIAGYKGDRHQLNVVGSQNLAKLGVKNAIEKSFEGKGMGPGEILARLTEQARGSMLDLLDDNGQFNVSETRKNGTHRLLKEITVIRDRENKKISYRYKIHDPQSALDKLAKIKGMYIDRQEIDLQARLQTDLIVPVENKET